MCRLYWYPLYIFARRRGYSPDDAKDLIQGFFLHVVKHRAFTGVDRLKGKFRSFLLGSFQNHLSDAGDYARRLKRGGDKEFIQLDAEEAEERYRLEPAEFLTPEKIFDARWAMTVLREALKKLRQEYATAGKTSTFETLKAFLDSNNITAPPSYEEVANRLEVTAAGVKTLIHRLRKRYTACCARRSPRGVRSGRDRRRNPCALRSFNRIRRTVRSMSPESQRTCSSCGNEFSGAMEFCPVCMLHKALADGVQSGESSVSEDTVKPTPGRGVQRFEHYELVKGEDGTPVEMGRGAMGVSLTKRSTSICTAP